MVSGDSRGARIERELGAADEDARERELGALEHDEIGARARSDAAELAFLAEGARGGGTRHRERFLEGDDAARDELLHHLELRRGRARQTRLAPARRIRQE